MSEREFPNAIRHSQSAITRYRDLDDQHGEAEATHRLGLIYMQRRELIEAMTMFERSLELDKADGERIFFRGEYERHVGYVHLMGGDKETAIPFFQRSLDARIEAGAIDASLFAAVTLGSALVATERFAEAKPHILYAMTIAGQINSPAGKARAAPVLGQIYENEGNFTAAREAFETALSNAESVGYTETARQMKAALGRLASEILR